MGTDGFEFIEYAAPDPKAMGQLFERLGFKRDVGARTTLEGAFSENLKNQQATTDFGVYLALARRF